MLICRELGGGDSPAPYFKRWSVESDFRVALLRVACWACELGCRVPQPLRAPHPRWVPVRDSRVTGSAWSWTSRSQTYMGFRKPCPPEDGKRAETSTQSARCVTGPGGFPCVCVCRRHRVSRAAVAAAAARTAGSAALEGRPGRVRVPARVPAGSLHDTRARVGVCVLAMFPSEKHPPFRVHAALWVPLTAFYCFLVFVFPSCLHCLINGTGSDERKKK